MQDTLPTWTALPFAVLVLSMAGLPLLAPRLWEKATVQAGVVVACALPVVFFSFQQGLSPHLLHSAHNYLTFIATLGALYVAAGGVLASADLKATPATNVGFLLVGSVLASVIGTMGASVLLIRPFLRTNSQRRHTRHLVPFFILAVANTGGLLTPLGDPPLLIGFVSGVPFFWTLRLLPIWLLYTASLTLTLSWVERRAYAREAAADLQRDASEVAPFSLQGKRNLAVLAAIVASTFLPAVWRELALLALGVTSWVATPRAVHEQNAFSFAPMAEAALLFAGLFVCLVPIEISLARLAPALPLREPWQLFWGSGLLSAVLDNAPTYAAFAALARGLSAAHGEAHLIAGMTEARLIAISAGSVVMGATTYIGNAPNLVIKSLAERAGFSLPSFFRFALFALLVMLPAHLVVTALLSAW